MLHIFFPKKYKYTEPTKLCDFVPFGDKMLKIDYEARYWQVVSKEYAENFYKTFEEQRRGE